MSTQAQQRERRDALLNLLEKADAEWGARKEAALKNEAAFFKKILSQRTGSASARSRIEDKLADLAVDKISEFLTG